MYSNLWKNCQFPKITLPVKMQEPQTTLLSDDMIIKLMIQNGDLWNVKNLPPPPVNTCLSATKEIDVKLVIKTLREGVDYFSHQQILHTEAALLSRTIYRMKMKFRSAKDFKVLEKLNNALLNYLNLDIVRVLETVLECLPLNYKQNETYVPTKNMIDYVLVRLQGLGKLLWRLLETCKIAAQLAYQRLKLGHFWNIAGLAIGMTSRIFVIIKNMTQFTCNLYEDLLPLANKFSNPYNVWLPQNYTFPEHLSDWLGIDWLDLERTIIEIPDDEPTFSYFNLIDDSDDDLEINDEYVLIKDDTDDQDRNWNRFVESVDVGEIINLDESVRKRRSKRKREDSVIILDGASPHKRNCIDVREVINLDETVSNGQDTDFIPFNGVNVNNEASVVTTPPKEKPNKKKKNKNKQNPNNANIDDNLQAKKPNKNKKKKNALQNVVSPNNSVLTNPSNISTVNTEVKTLNKKRKRNRKLQKKSVLSESNNNSSRPKKKIKGNKTDSNNTNSVINSENASPQKKKGRNKKQKKVNANASSTNNTQQVTEVENNKHKTNNINQSRTETDQNDLNSPSISEPTVIGSNEQQKKKGKKKKQKKGNNVNQLGQPKPEASKIETTRQTIIDRRKKRRAARRQEKKNAPNDNRYQKFLNSLARTQPATFKINIC